ncbi:hypothetical protein ACFM35_08080 [Microbacterium sp. P01]|uniref:hypothetical protein n=1 Tax=unclassified Microbacterium TaxID=2609290 RepID=UPI00366EEA03
MDHDANRDQDAVDRASEHLEAALVPRAGSPLGSAMRTAASFALGLITQDTDSGPSMTDLVVTRRETGGEILRLSAGSLSEADQLLGRVRKDLAAKSIAEFLAEWRTDDDPVTD